MSKAEARIMPEMPISRQTADQVAVLVDGENISAALSQEIARRAKVFGIANVRRVYGNVSAVPSWQDACGFKMIHTAAGENSADMQLVIDAMTLSYEGGIDTFVIVSSDGDFVHLAHNLRERRFRVIGIGQGKAPDGYRAACSRFIEVDGKDSSPQLIQNGHSGTVSEQELDESDRLLRTAILKHKDPTGFPIQLVNQVMWKHGVKISEHPKRNWRNYLTASKYYQCDPKGPNARVRWVGPKR